jgi:hypothetical protein
MRRHTLGEFKHPERSSGYGDIRFKPDHRTGRGRRSDGHQRRNRGLARPAASALSDRQRGHEPRTITIEFQENTGSYTIHNSASVSLESSDIYGPFIWEAPVTDPTNYFRFCLGGSPGTIWIDQVIIYDPRYTAVRDRRLPPSPVSSRIISQNYPNPFNAGTVIQYQLPEAADVRVAVFDLQGRQVAELLAEKQDIGDHWVRWNGLSGTGESLASGVYVYRIEARTREKASVFSKKIIMLE